MENLRTFTMRLCQSVGCYSHPNQTPNHYSLKKYDSVYGGHMGVFGWVRELKRKAVFEVSSYKVMADRAGVSHLADSEKRRFQWEEDGVLFYVKPDSNGSDYQKTVKALIGVLALI